MKETNKLSRMNLDREAPVYLWGKRGEIKPDVAYFTSIERINQIEASYSKPIFEIEVVNKHGKRGSVENIHKVLNNVESMQEAFLYNYETKRWTRYTRTSAPEATDFSSVFKIHLATLLSDSND